MNPAEGYYVEVDRYYPEDNSYETIARENTDIYGQFVTRLVENTVKYRFRFYDTDNELVKSTGDLTIACRATICVLPFIIEDTTDVFEQFENVTDYDWSLSFDESLNRFIFTWNDVSGVSAVNRLVVDRYQWNATSQVCNTTSSYSSGTLICDVGSTDASYTAQVFRSVSGGHENRIAVLSQTVGTDYQTFGTEGVMWAFLVLMTMLAVGYWYPPVGIIIYLAAFLLFTIVPIIYINPFLFIAVGVIGVIFIWAFGGKG